MYNAAGILKTKYFDSLKGVLPSIGVFKDYVPHDLISDSYVLLSNVQQVDASTINKHNVKAFITVTIYTKAIPDNSGLTMEGIADAIFSLYPTPQSYPVIAGYQVSSLQLESDNELTVSLDSGNTYINRTLIFSHILNKLN